MDYVAQVLKPHHSHNNDTTGNTPIPEIPHQRGLQLATSAGQRTLWIGFGFMAAGTLVFFLSMIRQPKKQRLFHHITAMITLFAAVAYYAMATHTGVSVVKAPGDHAYREVYWARYADWAITTPLLLIDLALLAGLPAMDILLVVMADILMIALGLFGALDSHLRTRWGFYAFSCVAYLYVLWQLVVTGRRTSKLRGDRVGNAYLALTLYTILLWTAYPIIWALAEGTNFVTVDTEILVYAVLDVLAKVGFGGALLVTHSTIAESGVSLSSFWVEPAGNAGGYGAISQDE